MKKIIFITIIALFGIISLFVSCKPSAKEEAAQENVDKAKEDLSQARKEANQEEWQNFKNDMNATIDANDAKIAQLKMDMKDKGKSANAAYDRNIDTLKAKNERLKLKMNKYKNDANSDWQSFRTEFSHDVNDLGTALKNFTVNNNNNK